MFRKFFHSVFGQCDENFFHHFEYFGVRWMGQEVDGDFDPVINNVSRKCTNCNLVQKGHYFPNFSGTPTVSYE